MKPSKSHPLRTQAAVFIILSAALFATKNMLAGVDIDYRVVLGGNLVLFAVSIVTTTLSLRSIDNPNPHAFTRTVYLGFVIRLFACAIAAGIYIISQKNNVNKYGLFACMLIYFVYTFIEVSSLQKILKEKKNA